MDGVALEEGPGDRGALLTCRARLTEGEHTVQLEYTADAESPSSSLRVTALRVQSE